MDTPMSPMPSSGQTHWSSSAPTPQSLMATWNCNDGGFPWQDNALNLQRGPALQIPSWSPLSPPPILPRGQKPGFCDLEDAKGADPNDGRFAREFTEAKTIGTGQFATVLRARNKIDQQMYAVKKQKLSGDAQATQQEALALASVALKTMSCPNVVRYFSSWVEDGYLYIQTELCDCSLRDVLAKRSYMNAGDARFAEKELTLVLRQVSSGLASLHSLGFAHLDIKPDNILIVSEDCYKVADLGLVTASATKSRDDISEGDCRYLAREVLKRDISSLPSADIFALGLVCYELATIPVALPRNGNDWQRLRDGHLDMALMPQISNNLCDLLHRMVSPVPADRPTSKDILQELPTEAEDCLRALREELREAKAAAERNQKLADGYLAQVMYMKRQGHDEVDLDTAAPFVYRS